MPSPIRKMIFFGFDAVASTFPGAFFKDEQAAPLSANKKNKILIFIFQNNLVFIEQQSGFIKATHLSNKKKKKLWRKE